MATKAKLHETLCDNFPQSCLVYVFIFSWKTMGFFISEKKSGLGINIANLLNVPVVQKADRKKSFQVKEFCL